MLVLSLALLLVPTQIGAPHGVRLLDDAPLLAQVPPPMVPADAPSTDAQVSAQQLRVDIDSLKRQRPGLGGGITLISIGGSASLIGALYMGLGGSVGSVLFIMGAVALGIGLPMVAIGVWLIYNRLDERKRIDDELDSLNKMLKLRLQQAPQQQQQRQRVPSPQLDVPPPQVLGPDSSVLLARF